MYQKTQFTDLESQVEYHIVYHLRLLGFRYNFAQEDGQLFHKEDGQLFHKEDGDTETTLILTREGKIFNPNNDLPPIPALEFFSELDPLFSARMAALKEEWLADPIWDIEETAGFEPVRDILLAYRKRKEAELEESRKRILLNKNRIALVSSPSMDPDNSEDGLTKLEYVAIAMLTDGSGDGKHLVNIIETAARFIDLLTMKQHPSDFKEEYLKLGADYFKGMEEPSWSEKPEEE